MALTFLRVTPHLGVHLAPYVQAAWLDNLLCKIQSFVYGAD